MEPVLVLFFRWSIKGGFCATFISAEAKKERFGVHWGTQITRIPCNADFFETLVTARAGLKQNTPCLV
jgi:hypothetical protein